MDNIKNIILAIVTNKRIKSALWIALAGFMATVLTVTLQVIQDGSLGEFTTSILVIVLTAVLSQITKWLNTQQK